MFLVRLLLLWIKCKPNLLKETEFTSRLQIWPGYCKLLNNITEHVDSQYSNDECKLSIILDLIGNNNVVLQM